MTTPVDDNDSNEPNKTQQENGTVTMNIQVEKGQEADILQIIEAHYQRQAQQKQPPSMQEIEEAEEKSGEKANVKSETLAERATVAASKVEEKANAMTETLAATVGAPVPSKVGEAELAEEAEGVPPLPTTSLRRGQAHSASRPGAFALSMGGVRGGRHMNELRPGQLTPAASSAIILHDIYREEEEAAPPLNSSRQASNNMTENVTIEAHAVEDVVEAHAKPMEWWTPRKTTAVVFGALVVLAVIVATTTMVVLKSQKDNSSSEDELAPTLPPSERLQAIAEVLLSGAYAMHLNKTSSTSNLLLEDPSSPQYQALQWIALEDALKVPVQNVDHLTQRYALAVLYFSTAGPDQWVESYEFLQPEHECSWSGAILCHGQEESEGDSGEVPQSSGAVTGIELQVNGLVGRLPDELSFLTQLQLLDVGSNDLFGTLPPKLLQLTHLDLSRNRFSGSIPDDYTTMVQLEHFHIQMNPLNGTIPQNFGALIKLTSLNLEEDYLTGTVPESMWDLSHLQFFNIESQKKLAGTISTKVQYWDNVTVFLVNMNNGFTGSIPSEVGLLTNLEEFKTAGNHMRGTVPTELVSPDILHRTTCMMCPTGRIHTYLTPSSSPSALLNLCT